jgi:hypothetical protein
MYCSQRAFSDPSIMPTNATPLPYKMFAIHESLRSGGVWNAYGEGDAFDVSIGAFHHGTAGVFG